MTFAQEKRLAQMTADGVFTTSELVDMLSNPNKKKGYFYIGLQRTGGPLRLSRLSRGPAASPSRGRGTSSSSAAGGGGTAWGFPSGGA